MEKSAKVHHREDGVTVAEGISNFQAIQADLVVEDGFAWDLGRIGLVGGLNLAA